MVGVVGPEYANHTMNGLLPHGAVCANYVRSAMQLGPAVFRYDVGRAGCIKHVLLQ